MACETVPSGRQFPTLYVSLYLLVGSYRHYTQTLKAPGFSEASIIIFQTSQRYVPEKSNFHFPTDISLINSEQV